LRACNRLRWLDRDTGEMVEKTLTHESGAVRAFYASIPPPVVVGIEATGSMGWFLRLMEELAIECRVGHPTAIRKAETRRQKHDRRDAALLLQLLAADRFPAIWMPSTEYRDLRSLLLHRHQWVRMRTRVQNALHAIVLAHGMRRGHTLWNREGQALLASLPLAPHTAHRRSELQALYQHLAEQVDRLDERVQMVAAERPRATLLMTHPWVGPVTALATDVFVGDPARFLDGKALASYVGMIPREDSSGPRQRLGALSKQGNPFLRFLWCEAAAHAVRRDPDLQRFYRRKVVQKGFAESPRRGGAKARDSPLDHVARSDRLRGVLPSWPGAAVVSAVSVRECPGWRWSSCASDRNIDWATRLPHVEGVRTSHHGPP
jgi:transposase